MDVRMQSLLRGGIGIGLDFAGDGVGFCGLEVRDLVVVGCDSTDVDAERCQNWVTGRRLVAASKWAEVVGCWRTLRPKQRRACRESDDL